MIPEIQGRLEAATVNVKSKVIVGLFAKDVASALITGSILLILGGIAYGLAQYLDPALAAVAVGCAVLLLLTVLIFLAAKSLGKR